MKLVLRILSVILLALLVLAALIAKYNVTHVQGTPTTWKLLLQAGWTPPNKITALQKATKVLVKIVKKLKNRMAASKKENPGLLSSK